MVAREHGGASDLNLVVFGDTQLKAGERDADGALMVRYTHRIESAWRGGLGQTITLIYRHVCAAEERHQFRIKRSAAGYDPLGAAAEHFAQRGIDHRVERRSTCLGQRSGLALGADFLHIVLRGDHGRGERHALGTVTGFLGCGVIHLLQYTRNHDHHGRLGHLQVGDQRLDALRDVDVQLAGHANVVDGTCEGVRLRQEQQHGVPAVAQEVGHVFRQVQCGGAVVLVRHLHALGGRRGTGSIYDGTQIGLVNGINAFVKFLVAYAGTVCLDLIQATVFETYDMLQRRALIFRTVGLVAHVLGLDNQQTGIGIVYDVTNLLGGIGIVDGRQHAAAGHDRRVEDIPLI